jgi:FMN phosphatase YigB (HAD superfamily)
VRAVLFLLEDTLVPDQTLERWQWSWRPQGPAISERHLRAAVKRGLHQWDRRRWEALTGAAPLVDFSAYREFLRGTLIEIAGRTLPDAETQAVVDRFPRAPVAAPFPEVGAMLGELKRQGLTLAAISERPGPAGAETLKRSGLLPMIDRFCGATNEALWLPAKDAYRAAVKELGLKPAEVAFVGRLYWSDVRAAARAGLPAVLLDRADWWPRVIERRIVSLADLPRAIATGLSASEAEPPEMGAGPGPEPPAPSPSDERRG